MPLGTITRATRLAATKGHLSCDLNGEAVLLHLDKGCYYGLNQVGAKVWQLLQQPRSFEEIQAEIVDSYQVDAATCQRDLQALLDQMLRAGLIEIVTDPPR
jgi:hypothetical protein